MSNIEPSSKGNYNVDDLYMINPAQENAQVTVNGADDENDQIWEVDENLANTAIHSKLSETATHFYLNATAAEDSIATVTTANPAGVSWNVQPDGSFIELLISGAASGFYLAIKDSKVVVKSTKQTWTWNKKVLKSGGGNTP